RLAGLVVMRERRQHLRAAHPLFKHLRRSLSKVSFHRDAADSRPPLLPSQNPMHQVTELMEKSNNVRVLHQSRVTSSRLGKVTDQDCFRKLLAANTVEHRRHFRMAVLARTRVHVEIETTQDFSLIEHIPGFYLRIPRGNILLLAEREVKQGRSSIQDSLPHFVKRQIWTDLLRIKVELRAPH